jgi:cytochrome c
MDSFELNKILGAILGTCLILLVTSFTAGAIFSPAMPEKPGYEIAVKEAAHGDAKEAAAAPRRSRSCRRASVEKGAAAAKMRHHIPSKRAVPAFGPNLFGINDHRGEGRGGFNFSAAMKAKTGA